MRAQFTDVDPETAWLVEQLVQDGPDLGAAATILTIEKLRRLEDLARHAGTNRQAFQKIVSARRILGDHASSARSRTSRAMWSWISSTRRGTRCPPPTHPDPAASRAGPAAGGLRGALNPARNVHPGTSRR